MASKKEKFLVFLKPDAYMRKYIGAQILERIYNNKDFKILAFKEAIMSEKHARRHYEEHDGKDFFPWLLKFIKLGPVLAMIVEGDIQGFRDWIGSTKCQEADSTSIRGKFGIWGGVNLVHASDSPETAEKELKIWQEEIGLVQDENAEKNIKEYISKWSVKQVNLTHELPKCCSEIIKLPSLEHQVNEKIFKILKEECYTTDEKTVKSFVDIIIEACKL